jgi:hypothetical protein
LHCLLYCTPLLLAPPANCQQRWLCSDDYTVKNADRWLWCVARDGKRNSSPLDNNLCQIGRVAGNCIVPVPCAQYSTRMDGDVGSVCKTSGSRHRPSDLCLSCPVQPFNLRLWAALLRLASESTSIEHDLLLSLSLSLFLAVSVDLFSGGSSIYCAKEKRKVLTSRFFIFFSLLSSRHLFLRAQCMRCSAPTRGTFDFLRSHAHS